LTNFTVGKFINLKVNLLTPPWPLRRDLFLASSGSGWRWLLPFIFKIKGVRIGTPMKNLRKYGKAPFSIAAIHGGPGAPGEMAPVAR